MFIEKGPLEGGPELLYEGHRYHLINQQFLFRVRHRLFEVAKMHNGSGSYVAKLKMSKVILAMLILSPSVIVMLVTSFERSKPSSSTYCKLCGCAPSVIM